MTRDYKDVPKSSDKKKRSEPKKAAAKDKKPTPGWVWLVTGLGIGLIIAAIVWVYDRSAGVVATDGGAPVVDKSTPVQKPKPKPAEAEQESEQRFDFYTLLPKLEVVIPESEIREEQQKLKPKEDVLYSIQVGSFRSEEEADSMKAQLAMLGVEANVQAVSSKGERWLRVRVGPFSNSRELNKIRNRLHNSDINTLLVKEQKQ